MTLIAGGFEVVSITEPAKAMSMFVRQKPDLILMDIVMPDMSGLDICRHIRKEMNYKAVPIIFLSTKDEDFDKFWALRQGGNAYLTKPYSPTDLINTVKSYL
ncbi:response regulator [Geminocystis sp. CENA526]|uniref:response regulator n=1 Tax=Geminocystis sp. CENA526 TaxID=1355871 RepID=UPI003D6FE016